MNKTSVDIDRIILNGFDFTPERAENIKKLIGLGLQRMIEQEGLSNGISCNEISNLSGSVIYPDSFNSDIKIATVITQNISHILSNIGENV